MKTKADEDAPSAGQTDDPRIVPILDALSSGAGENAWAEFLRLYSPLVLKVSWHFARDSDQASNCFLFVCEHLARDRFRRLRCFRREGPARFSTWLHAVTRNLCLDWWRREFGRQRVFGSVARRPRVEPLEDVRNDAEDPRPREIPDPGPDPETLAAESEQRASLARAVARLPAGDRLLIRLRFDEGLTLDQVARLTASGNAQAVDRRIRQIVKRLGEEIAGGTGKTSPSVV
jgi:RNA polymerase sigma factor (sigma-70 family)